MHNIKKDTIKNGEAKIEALKAFCPAIFERDNLLRRAFSNKNVIGNIPFTCEDAANISPFGSFSADLQTYTTQDPSLAIVDLWKFSINFQKRRQVYGDEALLDINYSGKHHKIEKEMDPSDRIVIGLPSEKALKFVVDFQNRKIGLGLKLKKSGNYLESYDEVISFDELSQSSERIEKIFEKSKVKIYGFEINEEQNLVAFKCQGGSFEKETVITLPMQIKLGEYPKEKIVSLPRLKKTNPNEIETPSPLGQDSLTEAESSDINMSTPKERIFMVGNHRLLVTEHNGVLRFNSEGIVFTLEQLEVLFLRLLHNDYEKLIQKRLKIPTDKIEKVIRGLLELNNKKLTEINGHQPPLFTLGKLLFSFGLLDEEFIAELKRQTATVTSPPHKT